jgi:peptide/nickel transport system substrate-binding protein
MEKSMSKQPSNGKLNRRDFLRVAATVSLGAVTACTTVPTAEVAPEPTKAAVEEKPAVESPKATATTAPEVAAPTEVVPTEEPSLGSTLIGELEGPSLSEVVPTSFNEAPQLAELVKAGSLPPVEERVSMDPLVIKPVHEIGTYGGVWRRGFTGPGDTLNADRATAGTDGLVYWDFTGTTVIPNIAKELKINDTGTEFTFMLRRGMKWSDGEPFTADDVLFWWNDIQLNTELNPMPSTLMSINGKRGTVEKIDDTTVVFKFPEPYWMFPEVVAGSYSGQSNGATFQCAHYLKAFHAGYTDKAELEKAAVAEKFDNWVNYFKAKADWHKNPDLPVVSPWKCVTPITDTVWTWERNPYSVWVDTEGNQLPYIDQVVLTLAENLEVLNLRAIAGEYDFQARHITLSKLPVLLENQEKGNYKVHLDVGNYGADLVVWINFWHQLDPYIGDLLRNLDFRRAMSLAINRDEMNETFWLGTGSPGNCAPGESNKFSPGPGARGLWAGYDPDQANALLDKCGLEKKDAQGYRLRADNGQRLSVEMQTKGAQFLEYTAMAEMIKEHWALVGVDVAVKEVERALGYTREANNETQFSLWTGDGSDNFFLWTASGIPSVFGAYLEYYNSHGEKGEEPFPALKRMTEIMWTGYGMPEAERIEAGKEFWQLHTDNCIQIGVVGLGAAAMGVRVSKNDMGNTPARQYCTPWVRNPGISRPQTFYWKK